MLSIVSIPISEASNGDKEEDSASAEEGRLRCSLPSWNAEEMGEVARKAKGRPEEWLTSYLNKFPISSSSTVFSVLKLCLVFPARVARDAFVLTSRALVIECLVRGDAPDIAMGDLPLRDASHHIMSKRSND